MPPVPPGRGRRRGRPSVDDVILLASHGVDADYLKALREAGFGHLESEDIIRLAGHGAEAEWLRAVREAGIAAGIDDLVKMVDHGVDAEWLAATPSEILGDLDIDELVSLADHGVEPQDLDAFLDLRRDADDE